MIFAASIASLAKAWSNMKPNAQTTLEGFEPNFPAGSDFSGSGETFVYAWGNNLKRAAYKGRACRVIARGKMRSVLIEFEDGERTLTSERALRKVNKL